MKLTISEKSKKDVFVSIFQLLKSCTSAITIIFKDAEFYIQGMDKAHVCLFEIKIVSSWFKYYEPPQNTELTSICVDSQVFHHILSINQEQHAISIWYNNGDAGEKIHIDLEGDINGSGKGDFNKFFTIPLAELNSELLEIPTVDYDAEFSIHSKKMCDISSQLLVFGDIMNIQCSEEKISICSKGICGEMLVNIPIDDLSEYSISEGENINVSYSLNYLAKMCMTTKLSSEIEFGVSAQFPMRIKYDLGVGSQAMFFIAPKIEDDD